MNLFHLIRRAHRSFMAKHEYSAAVDHLDILLSLRADTDLRSKQIDEAIEQGYIDLNTALRRARNLSGV